MLLERLSIPKTLSVSDESQPGQPADHDTRVGGTAADARSRLETTG